MDENWHQERDRLLALIGGVESGAIKHFDENDAGQLRRKTNQETEKCLRDRLEELNSRLGPPADA